MLFWVTKSKCSTSFVIAGFSGSEVPAIAPDPNGKNAIASGRFTR